MRDHEEFRNELIGRQLWNQNPQGGKSAPRMNDEAAAEERPAEAMKAPSVATVAERVESALRIASRLALTCVVAIAMLAAPVMPAMAAPPGVEIGIAVSFGPPPLPYYSQPLCPGPGFIWTPGYWAWDPAYGYYWVPGTWVMAPFEGALWTPGYWGWYADGDDYVWYPGYWGPVVGFYGGVDYGFGYTGYGYDGGYWRGRNFYYNREVNNINSRSVTYVYSRRVESRGSRISFNGGRDGIQARPTRVQSAAEHYRRSGAIGAQIQQRDMARRNPRQRVTVNHGRPGVAATARPGEFSGHGAVEARRAGGNYVQPPMSRAQPRRAQPRSAPESRSRPAQGNWHQFGRAPQRTAQPSRAERPSQPAREQRPVRQERGRQQQPSYAPRERQPQRIEARQPRENRPVMQRRESPPPRRQAEPAPRGRSEPKGNAGNPHGNRGNEKDHGNPHGRHR
jgi:WXXGXW repeat (2 copies)